MTIYIVEDDKNIQEIESFALKNSGYEVRGFEYAKDFYAALDEQIPDLVLSLIHIFTLSTVLKK